MKFKGKVGLILWLVVLLVLGCGAYFVSIREKFDSVFGFGVIVVVFSGVLAVVLWMMIRNEVIVTDTSIIVKLGMTTTTIERASIQSVKKVTSVIASAGTSAKRIEIIYKAGYEQKRIYISPKDRDGFLEAIDKAS